MTINEGLTYIKMLKQRHAELSRLQMQNARKETHYYAEKPVVEEPTYNVKDLDTKISRIAREIRKLDSAIKSTNAVTEIINYNEPDESIFDGPQ